MLGEYGDLAYVMLCNTVVLWEWSVINPCVSSGGTSNSTILPRGYQTDPAGIALDPISFLCPSRSAWPLGTPAMDLESQVYTRATKATRRNTQ